MIIMIIQMIKMVLEVWRPLDLRPFAVGVPWGLLTSSFKPLECSGHVTYVPNGGASNAHIRTLDGCAGALCVPVGWGKKCLIRTD